MHECARKIFLCTTRYSTNISCSMYAYPFCGSVDLYILLVESVVNKNKFKEKITKLEMESRGSGMVCTCHKFTYIHVIKTIIHDSLACE